MKRIPRDLFPAILAFALGVLAVSPVLAQLDRTSKGQAKDMLKTVRAELKADYFDSNFRGVDIDARFKAAEEKIEAATSMGQALGIIAQVVLDLDDSHTKFFPPARATKVEYGWRMKMIGDKCLVTAVKPKSDAEKAGLKVGDQIVQIEGFKPSRKDLWKINYYYNTISLRAGFNLKVLKPGETSPRELNVPSKVVKQMAVQSMDELIREIELEASGDRGQVHQFNKLANTIVWKMPSFVLDPEQIDQIMKNRIKGSANLILDLRGNGGGYVVALERLAGYFVEKDTEIATLKGRKPMKPQMAKTAGENRFTGKLIVLIDSESGSASEIFARFMQLQQRGVVMGDQSAGAVMQSRSVPMKWGSESVFFYGMSITNADVTLADGVSLEHVGVTPQIKIVPTPAEVAAGHDPVLASAFKLLEVNITAESAGQMLPYRWEDN